MSASFHVYFRSADGDLTKALAALLSYGLTASDRGGSIMATRPGAPRFTIAMEQGAHVREAARDVSVDSPFADAVAQCDGRFNVSVDDLDAAQNEINTMLEVMGALQDAARGYLYLPWNGTLTEPWED